ncbi:TetR/AcrR family transcriptional regulator [Nocardia africana]|uniref:Tetracyclin repressor, C-terminal all-alpha domain n=1 Tax=Nocardia africana TaxID=134964 RepID=A0A378X235_9NOCA|nr:TetR/AcrR family transcriptional regulator [Nocardia africana]MCC3316909.1 TetR/AcrR family transcriptional regulator [Nocardia africana]SUA47636.1 Tetracyclin repressor, C-terminal all-alpha domain [Nocardia africana]
MTEDVPGPLIWSLPEPPGRPTTNLSRAGILRAAMTIADAEGARALTMRRVAQAVGASTPMSLYRYVGSKDGLVDLMIDAVYGEIPLADTSAPDTAAHPDWRGELERLALDTWTIIQRHLWFGELVHTRPPLGPNALRYFDFRFAMLEPLGLSADDLSLLTGAVDGHLFGAALQVAEERRMRARVGLATDQQLAEAAKPLVEPLIADGRHPAFTRWFHGRTGAGPADPVAWTLRCLLDGITARMGLDDPSGR